MQIGIDARMMGPNVGGGGLGRYVEQLIKELPGVDSVNRYVLFQQKIPWYTLQEQWFFPKLIDRQHLDLVHFPHWNVPVHLKTPFVVTIHDLILLSEPRSARATTLHPLLYAIKYRGFRHVLSHAVYASKKIIAVSKATKQDILKHFPDIAADKIAVIYEGVTPFSPIASCLLPTPFPYLLYVGNCYPHKNIETLLEAFDLLHKAFPDVHLILAGRSDVFSKRLERAALTHPAPSFIHFASDPTDERLAQLFANAKGYVFPSRIEGFGLPPLEAMSMRIPVAASDIPSLREILADGAIYFPPNDAGAMAETLKRLLTDSSLQAILKQKGEQQIAKYSWKKMAQQTVSVYQSCARS